MQRVGVFVDVQNMFYSARTVVKGKIDYQKFLDGIVDGRDLVQASAYIIQMPEVNQSGFHDALNKIGYDLRIKEAKVRDNEKPRGNWDIGMAVDVLCAANRFDTVALCTGNGDFTPLVEALKLRGIRVEVVGFEKSTSIDLKRACTVFVPIKDEWWFADAKKESHNSILVSNEDEATQPDDDIGNRVDSNVSKFGSLA